MLFRYCCLAGVLGMYKFNYKDQPFSDQQSSYQQGLLVAGHLLIHIPEVQTIWGSAQAVVLIAHMSEE